jgi:hypothetical protein
LCILQGIKNIGFAPGAEGIKEFELNLKKAIINFQKSRTVSWHK